MSDLVITSMQPDDWERVSEIYQEGIDTKLATFEIEVPTWERWNESHLLDARLLAELDGNIVGWAALSPVSARPAYAGVAEVSLYVAEVARGRGVGKRLLGALVQESERIGLWTLQAVTFRENTGSVALHKKCGFREVGVREKIARLDGVWRDTVLLERRSQQVE